MDSQINNSSDSQSEIIDLMKYIKVVMKAKWKILSFSVVTTILVSIFVMGMTPIYNSTASLLLKTGQDKAVSIDTVYSLDTSRKEYFLTQYEILKSRAIAEEVIDTLNIAEHPEYSPSEGNVISQLKESAKLFIKKQISSLLGEDASVSKAVNDEALARSARVKLVDTFLGRVTITPVSKTQLVNITFESQDPVLAASVANAIGDTYITQGMSAQLNATKKAADWIKVRLDQLRENLEESAAKLKKYRIEENLIDINSKGVRSIASDELESLTKSYLAAKQRRYEAETIALFVSKVELDDIDSLLSIPEIGNNTSVKAINDVEIESEKRVSELSFRYGNKHPKLVAAKAELAAVRNNLTVQVNKLVRGINKDLSAAQDNERRLEQALIKEKQNFQLVTNKEEGYIKLSREVEANRNIYDSFLQRFKEMDITTDLETQKAQIVDLAQIPSKPIRPRKTILVSLAFALSVIFAVVVTFIFDVLNDTFRGTTEIESKLGQRVLGIVPLLNLKRKQSLPLYAFFDDAFRPFSEAIRTLRTGFVLSHIDTGHKVVIVTSSVPNEGKTTTSVNIAFSMAQMEKTLLIEADMRRPSFTRVFSLVPYQVGLSNVILGMDKFEDGVFHDNKSGLDILSAGFIPSNPLELLSSDKFTNLLNQLREKYDRIVIDCPPTLAVSDAQVLSKNADSLIYVVRSGYTKQGVAKQGVDRLLEVSAKIDGIVLNRVDINKIDKNTHLAGYYDSFDYTEGKS